MASNSVIKGLTVEIGANTTKFSTALKDLDKDARDISKDLKTVNESLKLDSTSTEKAADKLKLLQEAAQNASKKVDLIKQAIQKLNEQEADKSTEKYKNALADLERQLESAEREQELANEKVRLFGEESETAGQKALTLGDHIKANVIASAITGGLAKVGDLFANIARKALDAAREVVNFAKNYATEAVNLAAAYEDQIGYSEQVFENMAGVSQQWVEDNSVRLRIYKGELQEYVNQFGALFNGFGFGREEALKMSEALVSLAADLRSATGKDINDIIGSLVSGFSSSTTALKQFGVVTSETAIQAKALEMGLVNIEVDQLKVEKATLKLTEANQKAAEALQKYGEDSLEYQKAALAVTEAENAFNDALGGTALSLDQTQRTSALMQIVMEDLNYLLGQSDKEAGNYNSQLDTMKTIMQNLKEEIGERLLPVYTEFLKKINEFLQSDAGKAVMDALADSVGILADKVMELLQDEKMTEWIEGLKEKLPQAAEKVLDLANKIVDLIPKIEEITQKVFDFLDLDGKIKDSKQAYIDHAGEVKKFAQSVGEDFTTVIDAIKAYSIETDTALPEIYNNWGTYEPMIEEYINQITTTTEGARTDLQTALDGMPEDMQDAINRLGSTDVSMLDALMYKIQDIAQKIAGFVQNIINSIQESKNWAEDFEMNPPVMSGNDPYENTVGYASGGRPPVGRMVRVNDDAGHRPEWFIPDVPGTILNGDQTERIMNSVNNSRNFSGGINIYVNSYGMNVAEVAEELGQAFQNKIRMSGAVL